MTNRDKAKYMDILSDVQLPFPSVYSANDLAAMKEFAALGIMNAPTYCDLYSCNEECPRYGDDCDGEDS